MQLDIPECYKRGCKYYLGVKSDYFSVYNYCKAFPDGIPRDIAYGSNTHSEVQKGQVGDFVYQKRSRTRQKSPDKKMPST